MSDTVKKWHEMQEEKSNQTATADGTFIYESPDGGKTVTRRPFMGDISEREVIQKPTIDSETREKAYTILTLYSEDSIRLAAKILDIGE